MARIRAFLARTAIFAFAAAAAFYALYVTSNGRLNVQMEAPQGAVLVLSGLASRFGRAGIADMLSRLKTVDLFLAFMIFMAVCLGGELCFQGSKRTLMRRRAVRGIGPALTVIAAVWVLLRLNNTSLFSWNHILGGNEGFPLFGTARRNRQDEYALWTPMALSQEALGWPGVNTLMGGGTDVTWVSMGGLPAWNSALIFKPLYWGFLLFGSEVGLSMLCICRLVLLFTVSRKTALLYTGNNQRMSFLAAVILTLSPMIQWFISQSIAEVLIFGQGMALAVHGLLRSESTERGIGYAVLNAWLLGCFVMVGYPAWLIPVMYILMPMLVWMFLRKDVKNRNRKLGILLLALLPSLAALGLIVYDSWDTLQAIRNSAYPGSRLITGGLSDSWMLTGGIWNQAFKVDLTSIFFPLDSIQLTRSNRVDASPILSFAPAGLVLSVEHQWREKKADSFSIAVSGVMALFWIFTYVELPAWLCKATLLSQCSRPVLPISLCEVLLLIRARARGGIRDPRLAGTAAVLSAGINIGGILYYRIVSPSVSQLLLLITLYLLLFTMLYADFSECWNRLAVFFACCVLLLAGGFVNPVQQGIGMIDDFELVHTLRSIENDPGDLYAMEMGFPQSNVPLLAGKRCISTDQPYADFERWAAVDPDRKFADAYNRLCHVSVSLAEEGEETDFREEGNYIFVRLTREDLNALGVNYLITPRESLENAVRIAYVETDRLYIWKLQN